MNRNWREIPREQQVMIYAVGMLDDMVASGLLVGGRYRLTEGSKKAFEEMAEEGFSPTQQEIHGALNALQA